MLVYVLNWNNEKNGSAGFDRALASTCCKQSARTSYWCNRGLPFTFENTNLKATDEPSSIYILLRAYSRLPHEVPFVKSRHLPQNKTTSSSDSGQADWARNAVQTCVGTFSTYMPRITTPPPSPLPPSCLVTRCDKLPRRLHLTSTWTEPWWPSRVSGWPAWHITQDERPAWRRDISECEMSGGDGRAVSKHWQSKHGHESSTRWTRSEILWKTSACNVPTRKAWGNYFIFIVVPESESNGMLWLFYASNMNIIFKKLCITYMGI